MPWRRHRDHAGDHHHPNGTLLDRGWRYDAEVWLLYTFVMGGQISQLRRQVLQRAELRAGSRVLDAGCGTGTVALQAAPLVGVNGHVAGIDPAPRQIARAQAKARRAGQDIEFRQATIQDLPFADESFDAVTSVLMMHHLPPELRAGGLAELRRVLEPRGRLLVADFDAAPGSEQGHGHQRDDGRYDLAAAITSAGFHQLATSRTAFSREHHGWSGVTLTDAVKP